MGVAGRGIGEPEVEKEKGREAEMDLEGVKEIM